MKTKQRRESTTNEEATVSVGTDRDIEIDWTPAKARIHPRVVTVKQGKLQVNVEEVWLAQGKSGSFIFMVGAGDGTGGVRDNLFSEDFSPDNLDLFISLLTIARDKARELGMPSDQRGTEVTVSDFDQNEGCADEQRNPLPPATVRCRTIDGEADGVSLHLYEMEPGDPSDLRLTVEVTSPDGRHAALETFIRLEQVDAIADLLTAARDKASQVFVARSA